MTVWILIRHNPQDVRCPHVCSVYDDERSAQYKKRELELSAELRQRGYSREDSWEIQAWVVQGACQVKQSVIPKDVKGLQCPRRGCGEIGQAMTQEQYLRWKSLDERATKGPWHLRFDKHEGVYTEVMTSHSGQLIVLQAEGLPVKIPCDVCGNVAECEHPWAGLRFRNEHSIMDWKSNVDAEFIVESRQAVSVLLKEVDRLRLALSISEGLTDPDEDPSTWNKEDIL